ncbi:hypothetical protein BUALT_Bualt07G0044700 [Buddleja alternifolia]|uniref:F-box domain-containing protein n=1 Tax=Buddleja alternifolia TaxID=168488 RepID=A0AAV6X7Y1_9LAMI|nr:hypothetical protein BUALT_Bualt07G0044700 [Buddleja alternifolia]
MEEIRSRVKNVWMPNSIDRLPDEMLIAIVSRLPMKDAVRTSILAHKWRYFWVFSSVLHFDGFHIFWNSKYSNASLDSQRITFGNLVDSVLQLHTGSTIEGFRIRYQLDSTNSNDIDRWVKFAFTKRVTKLELHLLPFLEYVSDMAYVFPNICDPIERLRIFPTGLSSCESLVALRLSCVNVTGEVLEFFISNCPLLEELCVEDSISTTSLITSCPSMRLRHLKIHNCPFLSALEISSPNLLSHLEIADCPLLRSFEICSRNLLTFTFRGREVSMTLKNVSSLINLWLVADVPEALAHNLVQISRCLSRLENLWVHISTLEVRHPLPKFPNLPRLKKLWLNVKAYGYDSLLCLAPLIDAAPMLREIALKVTWRSNIGFPKEIKDTTEGQKHEYLEVLEIICFTGSVTEVEFAQYVIEHAVSLKKVVIFFNRPLARGEKKAIARKAVRLLESKLSEGVELIAR